MKGWKGKRRERIKQEERKGKEGKRELSREKNEEWGMSKLA